MKKECGEDKSWLKTKINEFKMLNNTLVQLVENGANEETINGVKRAINDTLNDINDTRRDIELEKEKDIFSFYDGIEKNDLLQEKKDYGCGVSKNDDVIAYTQVEGARFSTNLDKVLGLPKEVVESISFDLMTKHLSVCINDFVGEVNGVKTPVMDMLMDFWENEKDFSFTITHYGNTLQNLYVERYYECKIEEIYRDSIDVSSVNEYSKIQIFISYQGVKYEATD